MKKLDEPLDTKGITVAYQHPTPKGAAWACADHDDAELFDPVDPDALAEALVVCGGCGVRALCLELGVRRSEWGVWGGVLLENGKRIEKVRQRGRPKKASAA